MAQIFASDRGNHSPQAAATSKTAARDTAPETALAILQSRADASSATARLTQMQKMESAPAQRIEEDELQGKFKDAPLQRVEEEEMLQGKATGETLQRMGDEEEDLMQGKAVAETLQRQEGTNVSGGGASGGGLPANLQHGIEALSGADLSGVNVHYNSSQPAQMNAHAYAQGTDIHLASGQEKHLGHEAWHVVQQQQGRVQPTMDVGGTPVNDDAGLEKEADVMGAKASQMVAKETDT